MAGMTLGPNGLFLPINVPTTHELRYIVFDNFVAENVTKVKGQFEQLMQVISNALNGCPYVSSFQTSRPLEPLLTATNVIEMTFGKRLFYNWRDLVAGLEFREDLSEFADELFRVLQDGFFKILNDKRSGIANELEKMRKHLLIDHSKLIETAIDFLHQGKLVEIAAYIAAADRALVYACDVSQRRTLAEIGADLAFRLVMSHKWNRKAPCLRYIPMLVDRLEKDRVTPWYDPAILWDPEKKMESLKIKNKLFKSQYIQGKDIGDIEVDYFTVAGYGIGKDLGGVIGVCADSDDIDAIGIRLNTAKRILPYIFNERQSDAQRNNSSYESRIIPGFRVVLNRKKLSKGQVAVAKVFSVPDL